MKRVCPILIMTFLFGVFINSIQAQEQIVPIPKKAELDKNYDGVVDRVEYYDQNGALSRIETDSDFNGKLDEWVYYKNGVLEKAEKDTNGDGKADTWVTY